MKRTGYIFLLIILLLQSGGILLIYHMQQCYVQFEMRESLNDSKTEFQKLTLSFNDFQKGRINNYEISIKGKMYDVKSVHAVGDSLELLVINDKEEENILEKIKDFSESNNPDNELPRQIQQLLSLNYLSPDSHFIAFIPALSSLTFYPPNLNIVSNKPGTSTPPPELF